MQCTPITVYIYTCSLRVHLLRCTYVSVVRCTPIRVYIYVLVYLGNRGPPRGPQCYIYPNFTFYPTLYLSELINKYSLSCLPPHWNAISRNTNPAFSLSAKRRPYANPLPLNKVRHGRPTCWPVDEGFPLRQNTAIPVTSPRCNVRMLRQQFLFLFLLVAMGDPQPLVLQLLLHRPFHLVSMQLWITFYSCSSPHSRWQF